MTRNLSFLSTDRIFNVSWLPCYQLEKYVTVLFNHFKPSGRKNSLCTPSPSEICFFHTPHSLEFPGPSGGGGIDIFWNHRLPTWSILKKKMNILYWQLQQLSIVEMASLPVEVRSVYLIVGGVMTMMTAEINQMKSDAVSTLEWFLYRFTGFT